MPNSITIQIDQATLGAGTPGVTREDGVVAQLATLTDPANAGMGFSFVWTLVVPEGSSTVLSSAIVEAPTFTPDIPGTYLAFLEVTDVTTVQSWTVDAIGQQVSTQGGFGVAQVVLGNRIPGEGETVQFPGTWQRAMDGILRPLDGQLPTVDEKGAMVGTDGTPSAGNPFVTDSDSRLAASGGTLDDSYDFGGAGAGRTITADNGFVELVHSAETGLRITTGAVSVELSADPAGAGNSYLYTSTDHTLWLGSNNNLVVGVRDDGVDTYLRGNLDTAEARFGVFRAMNPAGGGGTLVHMEFQAGDTAAVSDANTGRIRYNVGSQVFEASVNGGAYATLGAGGGGGSLDDAYDLGSVVTVDAGAVELNQGIETSGTPDNILEVSGGAHTGLANALFTDVSFDLSRAVNFTGGGGAFIYSGFDVLGPTIDADAAQTIYGFTMRVSEPVASTNVTFGDSFAIVSEGGFSPGFGAQPVGDITYPGVFAKSAGSPGVGQKVNSPYIGMLGQDNSDGTQRYHGWAWQVQPDGA